jgi:hypothetical protein
MWEVLRRRVATLVMTLGDRMSRLNDRTPTPSQKALVQ